MMVHRSRGFTLVEVVVALTVLSMISLATLSSIRTFGSTQQKLDMVSERTQEMRSVSQLLRRVLVDAQAIMRQNPRGLRSYFQGHEQEVIWIAPFSASRTIGGLTIFRLAINDSQQLTLQFDPYVTSVRELDWSQREAYVLVPKLDEITISYKASPSGEWLSTWENASQNPDRVRLAIAANGRYWPDLIIRLNDVYEVSRR